MNGAGQSGLPATAEVKETDVRGVRIYRLPLFHDHRGNLTVGEFGDFLPFVPLRYFITYQVPGANVRGEHAHRAVSYTHLTLPTNREV